MPKTFLCLAIAIAIVALPCEAGTGKEPTEQSSNPLIDDTADQDTGAVTAVSAAEEGRTVVQPKIDIDAHALRQADHMEQGVAQAAEETSAYIKDFEQGMWENMQNEGHNNLIALGEKVRADAKGTNFIQMEQNAKDFADQAAASAGNDQQFLSAANADKEEQAQAERETKVAAAAEVSVQHDLMQHAKALESLNGDQPKINKAQLPQWAKQDVMKLNTVRKNMDKIAQDERSVAKVGEQLQAVQELGPME